MSYWRFAAMIATSTLVMFGLMYVHTYALDHVFFSETRAWMALLMGAVMAIVMLGFMLSMYKNRAANLAIFAGAGLTCVLAVWLVRSQVTVEGSDFMQAMIPHHSIAVLTSERAGIEDRRVRKLADEIIDAQRKEIAEMKYLIRALDRGDRQPGAQPAPEAEQVSPADAIRTADVAKTDLQPLTDAEVRRALGSTQVCRFSFADGSLPVAAALAVERGSDARGVIKLNGRLVSATARYRDAPGDGFALEADEITVAVAPLDAARRGAEAVLRVGTELAVGYDGFYACGG